MYQKGKNEGRLRVGVETRVGRRVTYGAVRQNNSKRCARNGPSSNVTFGNIQPQNTLPMFPKIRTWGSNPEDAATIPAAPHVRKRGLSARWSLVNSRSHHHRRSTAMFRVAVEGATPGSRGVPCDPKPSLLWRSCCTACFLARSGGVEDGTKPGTSLVPFDDVGAAA